MLPPPDAASIALTPAPGARARTVRTDGEGGPGHTYIFTRDLGATAYGSHHLVLSAEHHTSHLLHRLHKAFPLPAAGAAGAPLRDRFEKTVRALQRADHPHILAIEEFGWDLGAEGDGGRAGAGESGSTGDGIGPFVISDYTGDADGVVTLESLVKMKGGWLSLEEAKRAVEQLMSATAAAHQRGVVHGWLSMSQVHIDRRGSLLIELYGLSHALHSATHASSPHPPHHPRNAAADEVRSIIAIGYQLATGLLPIRPVIPVEHILEGVDRSWRDLFHTGLGPGVEGSSAAGGSGAGTGAGGGGTGTGGGTGGGGGGVGFASSAHALEAVRGLRIAGGGGIHEVGTSLRDLVRSMLTPER